MNSLTQKDLEHFWGKVNKEISNTFYKGTRCWEWVAGKGRGEYGVFQIAGKQYKSHRVAWLIFFGDIQDKMQVLHHCDNPPCVNPSHLFVGTHLDNMSDKVKKGRQSKIGPISREPSSNHSYKLTDDQVVEIRRRYARWGIGGENTYQLSAIFGVSPQEISNIVNGKRRK